LQRFLSKTEEVFFSFLKKILLDFFDLELPEQSSDRIFYYGTRSDLGRVIRIV